MIPDSEDSKISPERQATTLQRSLLFLVAAAVIVIDHFTKLLIEQSLPLNGSWAPVPELSGIFKLTHVSNTGAAFGLFPSGSLIFTLIAAFVAAIIVYYNFQLPRGQYLLRVALGLQLGGAVGNNFIDRLRLGHVTDFLDFGPWPVFNLADLAIVSGVVILGWLMLQEQNQAEEDSSPPGEGSSGEEERPPVANLASQRHNEQAT